MIAMFIKRFARNVVVNGFTTKKLFFDSSHHLKFNELRKQIFKITLMINAVANFKFSYRSVASLYTYVLQEM